MMAVLAWTTVEEGEGNGQLRDIFRRWNQRGVQRWLWAGETRRVRKTPVFRAEPP